LATALPIADKTTLDAVKSVVDAILGKNIISNGSVIKSIQRGTHNGGTSSITITISTINPAKAFVILSNITSGRYGATPPRLTSLNATSFVVSASCYLDTSGTSNVAAPFSWVVIEFY